MLYIRKATLITPTETISNGTLLLEGSKILALGPDHAISIPEGANVLDTHGQVLVPGFIELQINGGFGHDLILNGIARRPGCRCGKTRLWRRPE